MPLTLLDESNPKKARFAWFSIEQILKWNSVDSGSHRQRESLKPVLDRTPLYAGLIDSLQKYGFLEPLVCNRFNRKSRQGNGHHRLAAAIELGYMYVPYIVFQGKDEAGWDCFIKNVGKWEFEGSLLHPDNPTPNEILNMEQVDLWDELQSDF